MSRPDPEVIAGLLEGAVWKPVVGFEGLYEVSDTGLVRSAKTGKLKAQHLSNWGYWKVDLCKLNQPSSPCVHKLVASAFIPGSGPEANHINGITTDNRAVNLEWSNRSHNMKHSAYVLGNKKMVPIAAIHMTTGERKEYRSICEAIEDGFIRWSVYRCLNEPSRLHHGHRFIRTEKAA